jgi:hypothetical protein
MSNRTAGTLRVLRGEAMSDSPCGCKIELIKQWSGETSQQIVDAEIDSSQCTATALRETFENHTREVGKFVTEIYQIMVDPLDDPKNVAEAIAAIKESALRSREDAAELERVRALLKEKNELKLD